MKKIWSYAASIGACVAIVLGGGTVAVANTPGDLGDSESVEAPIENPQGIKTTHKILRFDHAIRLHDAAEFGASFDTPVLGYRFENSDIVGEYSGSSEQTVEEFLKQFAEKFGTQPEITGLIVEVPISASEGEASLRTSPTVLVSGAAVFDAPALKIHPTNSVSNVPPATRSGESMATAAVDWRPNDAEFTITQQSGRADFFHSYWWYNGSAPQMIPAEWGTEFEVNIYNDASYLNHRPNCEFGYKDAFWAKNYSWNWAVLRPDYQGASLSSLGAYADYNDLSDTCNRNSIAIGLRYPQNIVAVNGGYGIMIWVSAPNGNQATSQVGGTVQAVWDGFCTSIVGSLMAFTDCMGVYPGTWPASAPAYRLTANVNNGWTVPSKCWISQGKGLVAAVVISPC